MGLGNKEKRARIAQDIENEMDKAAPISSFFLRIGVGAPGNIYITIDGNINPDEFIAMAKVVEKYQAKIKGEP